MNIDIEPIYRCWGMCIYGNLTTWIAV